MMQQAYEIEEMTYQIKEKTRRSFMSKVFIRKVRAILTAPANINLIVVKVETSEPGLYGIGCATFAYRELAVKVMVEEYVSPLLEGRDVAAIEDLWHLMNNNSYWRNGPVTNNAISGEIGRASCRERV